MPIHALRNQYRGINAHLHSFWQATGTWNRFHNPHVTHLTEALVVQLLPMGYVAETEDSIQVRRIDDFRPRLPRPDILIRDTDPRRFESSSHHYSLAIQPIALAEITELEEDVEHPYSAIVLRPTRPDGEVGALVAWIELLSPSNKGSTSDANLYLAKRRLLLEKGVVFVEIDYLHTTAPTFELLPAYIRDEPGAYPYRIVVIDPRPDYYRANAYLHQFDVDAPVPKVEIPLNAGDIVSVDFNVVYQTTFERMGYGQVIDYAQLPMEFERYTPADQTRIARRMLAVMEAVRDGHDLATALAPLDVKDIPLDEALEAIRLWQSF